MAPELKMCNISEFAPKSAPDRLENLNFLVFVIPGEWRTWTLNVENIKEEPETFQLQRRPYHLTFYYCFSAINDAHFAGGGGQG